MIYDQFAKELQSADFGTTPEQAFNTFCMLAKGDNYQTGTWDFKKKIDTHIEAASKMKSVLDIQKFAWNCCLSGLGHKVRNFGRG